MVPEGPRDWSWRDVNQVLPPSAAGICSAVPRLEVVAPLACVLNMVPVPRICLQGEDVAAECVARDLEAGYQGGGGGEGWWERLEGWVRWGDVERFFWVALLGGVLA